MNLHRHRPADSAGGARPARAFGVGLKFLALTLLMIASAWVEGFGQSARPAAGRCLPPAERCLGKDCERGKPIIFGKAYDVPRLRLRLLDENTNKPLAGVPLTVRYQWEWLEYPYPEHPFGAWSGESYLAECVTDGGGLVEVEKYRVVPHGWYKGFYSIGHKPRFTSVALGFELSKCLATTGITKSEMKKCARKGVCEFTFRKSCNALLK